MNSNTHVGLVVHLTVKKNNVRNFLLEIAKVLFFFFS